MKQHSKTFKISTNLISNSPRESFEGSQKLEDFRSFIITIEWLLTRCYDFTVSYDNDDYLGNMLAVSEDNLLQFQFDFKFNISDPPVCGDAQLNESFLESVQVNRSRFDSYEDAYFNLISSVRRELNKYRRITK